MTTCHVYFYCKGDIFQNINMLEEQRKNREGKRDI